MTSKKSKAPAKTSPKVREGEYPLENVIVFFSYHPFPFVNSSEAVSLTPDGRVRTPHLGCVMPLLLLPKKEGQLLEAKFKKIEADHNQALKAVTRAHVRKMVEVSGGALAAALAPYTK